jgi:hypothetical protein
MTLRPALLSLMAYGCIPSEKGELPPDTGDCLERHWFVDEDGDGWGSTGTRMTACEAWAPYVERDGDCDDGDREVHPEAEEACDGVDNNCDTVVDEGLDTTTWYQDRDRDGYGSDVSVEACMEPEGYVSRGGDCDDGDDSIVPWSKDTCDGIDNNCNGLVDEDHKGDWQLVTLHNDGVAYEVSLTGGIRALGEHGLPNVSSSDTPPDGEPVVYDDIQHRLYGLDVCSWAPRPIGATGAGSIGGIAFAQDGRLLALDLDRDLMVELDPTSGQSSSVGELGFDLGNDGLAYDCRADILYGIDARGNQLFQIDPETGGTSGFLPLDHPFSLVGLEYDATTGTLLAVDGTNLLRVDPSTGGVTGLGTLGIRDVNDLVYLPRCPP